MAATAVTLNNLEGHSPVIGLFKCNPSNICAVFYTISFHSVLARFLCISRASRNSCYHHHTKFIVHLLHEGHRYIGRVMTIVSKR